MKILVLGANGRTGRLIVDMAISRGHHVNALVRDRQLLQPRDNLNIYEGSCLDRKVLDRALTDTEAVICSLHISRKSDLRWSALRSPRDLISRTIALLIPLMHAHGISRILTISACGVGSSKNQVPAWFSWMIRNSNIRYGYEDHERQEKLLMNSDMDWTIVRPVGLTNNKKDIKAVAVRASENPPSSLVPRRSVARFIIDTLEEESYMQETPTICQP